jgi:hypothetical protein
VHEPPYPPRSLLRGDVMESLTFCLVLLQQALPHVQHTSDSNNLQTLQARLLSHLSRRFLLHQPSHVYELSLQGSFYQIQTSVAAALPASLPAFIYSEGSMVLQYGLLSHLEHSPPERFYLQPLTFCTLFSAAHPAPLPALVQCERPGAAVSPARAAERRPGPAGHLIRPGASAGV